LVLGHEKPSAIPRIPNHFVGESELAAFHLITAFWTFHDNNPYHRTVLLNELKVVFMQPSFSATAAR
jgi:hypothetical protein